MPHDANNPDECLGCTFEKQLRELCVAHLDQPKAHAGHMILTLLVFTVDLALVYKLPVERIVRKLAEDGASMAARVHRDFEQRLKAGVS